MESKNVVSDQEQLLPTVDRICLAEAASSRFLLATCKALFPRPCAIRQ